MTKISAIRLTLPEFSTRLLGGSNPVVHLGESRRILLAHPSGMEKSALALEDELQRKILVVPPRKVAPEAALLLRAKTVLESHASLNEHVDLSWLAHPSSSWPREPKDIAASWLDVLVVRQANEGEGVPGLREPQVGALYAILAHWTSSDEHATVVMPTGTGKTETMLAVLLSEPCARVLVVVPSSALREQLFAKFSSLGCMRDIGVIPANTVNPTVGKLKHGLHTVDEALDFARKANVIVATAAALSASSESARAELAAECSHLFVDEAHHITAPTWESIRNLFAGKLVLQFTATPFRQDGKRVDGKIIYNYPLGRAQSNGYFRPIDLAAGALARLKEDIKKGLDHLLLARAKRIDDVGALVDLYSDPAPVFAPLTIHSRLSETQKRERIDQLRTRSSRVLVCVDMFGEGFDFPELKVAALHEVHKSLPVTLQFVGRFTRTAKSVGDASVVVNVADPRVDGELQALYAQDANWNSLLKRTSEGRIQKEVDLQEFIEHFSGSLPDQVPLWNLKPTFSTLIYRVDRAGWNKDGFLEPLPTPDALWDADNPVARTCIAVFARREEVRWGKYRDVHDWVWRIVIGYHNEELGLLFLHTNDYKALPCNQIAKGLVGDSAEPASGPRMFRVFHGIERPLVKNLGASKTGSVRFTMYFGSDVTAGLSQIEKAESELRNLAGWGYEDGDRVTLGCSTRQGKAWSQTGGPITEWRAWCDGLGRKIANADIDHVAVIQGFLRPEEIESIPSDLVAIAIDWGESILRTDEIHVTVKIGSSEFKLFDVELSVEEQEDGELSFRVRSEVTSSVYRIRISKDGDKPASCNYELESGEAVSIRMRSRPWIPLSEWVVRDPLTVLYADGSFSYNQFFVRAPCPGVFDADALEPLDWSGVDIRKESQGQARDTESIQARIIDELRDDFDIVFDDDAAGEVADVVAMRRTDSGGVLIRLVHCKFSSEDEPGARQKDLYEVCGQAQKCVRWKHAGMRLLAHHMGRRHGQWEEVGHSRFIKGDMRRVRMLEKLARQARTELEVWIVQPGLSKAKAATNAALLHLLGSTELFLRRTADAPLSVIVSE